MRISDLQALADQGEEGAAISQKQWKKLRNEPENCDLESERKPKEKKTRKMDLTCKENGGDRVIEEEKKKKKWKIPWNLKCIRIRKKKKSEKKILYLDENPLNVVQNY